MQQDEGQRSLSDVFPFALDRREKAGVILQEEIIMMNKLSKKFISVLVALALLAAMSAVAFAAEGGGGAAELIVTEVADNETVIDVGDGITLMITENADGTTAIVQYTDGEVTDTASVNRNTGEVRRIDENGLETIIQEARTDVEITPPTGPILYASTAMTYRGQITYSTLNGFKRAKAYYSTELDPGEDYNIYTQYQGLAGLTALVVGIFLLPGVIATSVALWILSFCGISLGAIGTFLSCELECDQYTVNWQFRDSDNTSHTNTMSGSRYTVTEAGSHQSEVFEDSTFFAPTAWNDPVFGIAIYERMFVTGSYSIYSWS
jgi:methionine-rich copper-binding protein CopC